MFMHDSLSKSSHIHSILVGTMLLITATTLCANEPISQAPSSQSADSSESDLGTYTGAMETVYPDWFKLSFLELEEDVAEAAEQGKRLMLLFHQDGCPYCNALVEHNLAQKDIEETLRKNFDVVEINMWGDRELINVGGKSYTEKTFAAALNVQFTPTLLFLTETGDLALRINGYYNPDQFRRVLDYVSGKHEQQMSFTDYSAQFNDSNASTGLVSRKYFKEHGPGAPIPKGKHKRPYILYFEQANCRNCESLHDDILSTKENQSLLAQFDLYQVDMWGGKPLHVGDTTTLIGRELAKQLNINYAPTLVLYDAGGQEIIRSEAWFKRFHTQSILDYVATDGWREQPSFQRYISARADALREQGEDVNIWD